MGKMLDLAGKKFGRLTAIRPTDIRDVSGCVMWKCVCDCGKTHIVRASALTSGEVQSCGCLQVESVKLANTKHGESHKRIYKVWTGMKQRCENPHNGEYQNYGARGIKICNEWKNPEKFIQWALANGYEENKGLSIERINNDRGYSPSNCKWATKKVQQNNRRVNHFLCYNGITKTITEWGDLLGIKPNTILCRVRSGYSVKDALAPVRM